MEVHPLCLIGKNQNFHANYMDDIFGEYGDFDEGFAHLRDKVVPRIAWEILKLSFNKIKLFSSVIDGLGVT